MTERLEQKIFGQMLVDAHQALACFHVYVRRRQQVIERGRGAAREHWIAERFALGDMQRITAVVVGRFAVCSARRTRRGICG